MDPAFEPLAHGYAVVACQSDEGWGEQLACRQIATGASTFDLHITDWGVFLLFGVNLAQWFLVEEGGQHVYALTTPDLEHFGTYLWPIAETASPMLTDTALERLPDGRMRVIYVSGGPWAPGTHQVKAALREGRRWVERSAPIFGAEGITDPSACSHKGQHHLFVTGVGSTRVLHAVGETPWNYTLEEDFDWVGAQVPYCFEDEGELRVIAQEGGGWSPPTIRTLREDGSFTPPARLWEPGAYPELASCTSPVVGRYRGKYLLFCAIHRQETRDPSERIPPWLPPPPG
ncbi:MAG: hypothetical protein ABIO70_21510 [Pseudomonadota bacterium]